MIKLFGFLKQYKRYVIFSILLTAFTVFIDVYQPKLVAVIIDELIGTGDTGAITQLGLFMVLITLISLTAGVGRIVLVAKATAGMGQNVRNRLFSHIQTFSASDFARFKTATLATRLLNDTNIVQTAATQTLRMLVRAPLLLIFSVVMAFTVNVRLACFVLGGIALVLVFTMLLMAKSIRPFKRNQTNTDEVNFAVQENVSNIRVVKSFTQEDWESRRFKEKNAALVRFNSEARGIINLIVPMCMLLLNIVVVFVLWFSGVQVLENSGIKVGEILVFVNYVTFSLNSITTISNAFVALTRATVSAGRINEILEHEPSVKNTDTAEDICPASADIEFKDVRFWYENGKPVLDGLSFSVRPSEHIGIIGGTASGKSTIAQLLIRLYDVCGGEVRFGGRNVRDYTLSSLRGNISVAFQKNVLFSGTIEDTLLWGKADASEAERKLALKNAQAADFVGELGGGEAPVLQGGVNVSGGQRQRLCVARALVKDAKALILDDSTSALDVLTEKKLLRALNEHYADRTQIIISQKISAVKELDRILVIDGGRAVGFDTHERLLESCDIYRELAWSQQSGNAAKGV